MEQLNLEINLNCQLCHKHSINLSEYQSLEETLKICEVCESLLERTTWYSFNIELYQKPIRVNYSTMQYYKVQLSKCSICYQLKICHKICYQGHFCCLNCSQEYFEMSINKRIVNCPIDECQQEIDHYIMGLFLPYLKFQQWKIFNYTMFCPNKNCKNTINLTPYKKINTFIIRIDIEHSECQLCQTKICNYCWTQFQDDYQRHAEICNSEIFRNELLSQYIKENQVLQCPKCKQFSEKDCAIKLKQIQQCQYCSLKFCLICNLGPAIIFNIFVQCQRLSKLL